MTKLVQLSDEAYRRLKTAKRPGESFSDVVVRRFPAGDLAELLRRGPKSNLAWHGRWQKEIDRLDKT